MLVGSFGLFFTLYMIFTRVAPVVAIAEVKSILKFGGNQYVESHNYKHVHGFSDHHGHEESHHESHHH